MRTVYLLLVLISLSVFTLGCQTDASNWQYILNGNGDSQYTYFSPRGIYTGVMYEKLVYEHYQNESNIFSATKPHEIDLPDNLMILQICGGDGIWVKAGAQEIPGVHILKYDYLSGQWQDKTTDIANIDNDKDVLKCKKLSDGTVFFSTDKGNTDGNALIADNQNIKRFSSNMIGKIEDMEPRSAGGYWILNRDGYLFSLDGSEVLTYGYLQKDGDISIIEGQPNHLWVEKQSHVIQEWVINSDKSLKPGLSFENKTSGIGILRMFSLDDGLLAVWDDSIWIIIDGQYKKLDLPINVYQIRFCDFDRSSRALVISTNVGVYKKVFP